MKNSLGMAAMLTLIANQAMSQDLPTIPPEQTDSILKCIENTTQELETLNTNENTMFNFLWEDRDTNRAIPTALHYGDFEEERRILSLIGEMTSWLMFSTPREVMSLCATFADIDGNIPTKSMEILQESAENYNRYDAIGLQILEKLRQHGQDLIDSGTPAYQGFERTFQDLSPSDFK
jgi:hypothetical protein